MSTNWHHQAFDSRGSLNLKRQIKDRLGPHPLLIRETDGIVILVSLQDEALQAHTEGRLDAWINGRLGSALPPAPIELGTTALTEAARLQRAREKHQMVMAEIQARMELARERAAARAPGATKKQDVLDQMAAEPADAGAYDEAVRQMKVGTTQLPQG